MATNPETPTVGPMTARKNARAHALIAMTDRDGNTITDTKGKPVQYIACPAGVRSGTVENYLPGQPGVTAKHRKAISGKTKPLADCVDRFCRNPQCLDLIREQLAAAANAYQAGSPTQAGTTWLSNLAWRFASRTTRASYARIVASYRANPPKSLLPIAA